MCVRVCVCLCVRVCVHQLRFDIQSFPQDELHLLRLKELDKVTGDRDRCRKEFDEMRKQRLDEFMAGFSIITNKLKEMYQVHRSLITGRSDNCSMTNETPLNHCHPPPTTPPHTHTHTLR